eukprot:gnl/Hemi2/27788_TR9182_c0_g1_i1.p1 gnl/Hemi2/27788_TR9182_c0_g1~~gnl/Hemi2/27788_TR9182_c0_g1_i1.p1  ORF type:complete len:255 (+),score=14.73 gnl/Hemi2/27788_TR9182_c0_g1_i1:38-766(+)
MSFLDLLAKRYSEQNARIASIRGDSGSLTELPYATPQEGWAYAARVGDLPSLILPFMQSLSKLRSSVQIWEARKALKHCTRCHPMPDGAITCPDCPHLKSCKCIVALEDPAHAASVCSALSVPESPATPAKETAPAALAAQPSPAKETAPAAPPSLTPASPPKEPATAPTAPAVTTNTTAAVALVATAGTSDAVYTTAPAVSGCCPILEGPYPEVSDKVMTTMYKVEGGVPVALPYFGWTSA